MTTYNDYLQDFPHGVSAIDTDFVRPRLDSSHLIVRNGRAAFVDTGTNSGVPRLLQALADKNLDPADVDYVLLTHIHLDHAGGAGLLMQHLPNAKLVVHPRGAGHMAAPDKLIAGTRAVYGDELYRRMYGDILPIPAERIVESSDGMRLRLGDSELELIHTPGHALHHYCIIDHDANAVFTGDTFGISYREFDTARGAFVFASTTPVQFDPQAAHASIDRLLSYGPSAAYLTHYSRVTDLERLAQDLHRDLDAYVAIARGCGASGMEAVGAIATRLREHMLRRLQDHGCTMSPAEVDGLLSVDIQINAQGLAVWLAKQA